MTPNTLILRTAGTNCDQELAQAFELAGASTRKVHLNELIDTPQLLDSFDMLGLPGGFSYGDDIAAGRIFANRLRHALYPALRAFVMAGKPVIGICNGFQLLVKSGLLPGFELPEGGAPQQLVTLGDNTNPRFVDRWVGLTAPGSNCIWTKGLDALDLPIAHGEGRFLAGDDVIDRLASNGQIALRYTDNPNGSQRDIAGICDPTGLVFGLMPHPERYLHATNRPDWTATDVTGTPAGLQIFRNAVAHVSNGASVTA